MLVILPCKFNIIYLLQFTTYSELYITYLYDMDINIDNQFIMPILTI